MFEPQQINSLKSPEWVFAHIFSMVSVQGILSTDLPYGYDVADFTDFSLNLQGFAAEEGCG